MNILKCYLNVDFDEWCNFVFCHDFDFVCMFTMVYGVIVFHVKPSSNFGGLDGKQTDELRNLWAMDKVRCETETKRILGTPS